MSSVQQMLRLGKGYGLSTVLDAYTMYMKNKECFFISDNFDEELQTFKERMLSLGLLEKVKNSKNKLKVIDAQIDDYLIEGVHIETS